MEKKEESVDLGVGGCGCLIFLFLPVCVFWVAISMKLWNWLMH